MVLDTPLLDRLRANGVRLTIPVILMRYGGLDGVALQANEYSDLLRDCIDVDVHLITGRHEGTYDEGDPVPTVIERLDFHHLDSVTLFANGFEIGPETEGVARISEHEWRELFETHKQEIKAEISAIVEATPHNAPVVVFNLLSLRHAHPAAASAIREIVAEHPGRAFMSHAADPDAERPEKLARIRPFVFPFISANAPDEEYSGGPYQMDNLYHVVLNPKQRENFLYRYLIEPSNVMELPDFLEFENKEPVGPPRPDDGFVDHLSSRCIFAEDEGYRYATVPLSDDCVYFLSPVRPVYRKRIKEAMLVAHHYGRLRNRPVAFVITHPDIDDRTYFLDTVKFANSIGLRYIHLGEHFTLQKLNTVYRNFAALPTVGVVASAAGGWENALNEMAAACIPYFMSISLNSYKPLTETIGITTYGMDFAGLHHLVEGEPGADLGELDLSGIAYMGNLVQWIDTALDPGIRQQIVEDNFHQAFAHLSREAAAERMIESVKRIYGRHEPTMEP